MARKVGEYNLVSEATGYSYEYVRAVAKGRRKNEAITKGLLALIQVRESVMQAIPLRVKPKPNKEKITR